MRINIYNIEFNEINQRFAFKKKFNNKFRFFFNFN